MYTNTKKEKHDANGNQTWSYPQEPQLKRGNWNPKKGHPFGCQ
jgi:hypothetical protein